MRPPLFGIDLGGTKTEGVVLMPDGDELLRYRMPSGQRNYAKTIEIIALVIEHLVEATGVTCAQVGIGIPGSVSPVTGLIRNANSTWLNGMPLEHDLAHELQRQVRISNDANCLALSESLDGAAENTGSSFAVVLGTGVGGGLIINNQIVAGAHGLGGEWGHIPLAGEQTSGPDCYCGRNGCVESYLSGPSLVREHNSIVKEHARNVEDVVELSVAGNDQSRAILDRYEKRLERALGGIVNTIDPEVFVLGGGVSNLPGLAERLPGLIAPHCFVDKGDKVAINIRKAKWGDSSGVRGAARLWEEVK